jgi:hypothetical protein
MAHETRGQCAIGRATLIRMSTPNHRPTIDPAEMSEAEIGRYVRSSAFLDDMARLEQILQERQSNGEGMPTLEQMAEILHLPKRVIDIVIAEIAAGWVTAAGGRVFYELPEDTPPMNKRN